jgi:hypothetical protein
MKVIFDFLSYRRVTEGDAELLMQWRTAPHVAAHMLTQIAPDLEKQVRWIQSCDARKDFDHRVFCIEGRDAGYCSITVTDPAQKIGQLGVYLGDLSTPRSLSMYNFLGTLNHAFFTMGLKKIINKVLKSNERTVILQRFNGYTIMNPEVAPEADVADSKQVIWFELTRESWLTFRAKFDYDKDWGGNPTGQMPSPDGEIP